MLPGNNVKEELSIAYAMAVAAHAGFAVEETRKDFDSVDVTIRARGLICEGATLKSPAIALQLKAKPFADLPQGSIPFDLRRKNYDDLIGRHLVPKILVLLVMPEAREEWLSCTGESLVLRRSAFWMSLANHPPSTNDSQERLYLPRDQLFTPVTLTRLLGRVAREEELRP
jgi:hypothetical protein